MLQSKYNNPLLPFVTHAIGMGEDGNTYTLLIDATGQTLIQQATPANATIMFNLMPSPDTDNQADIATAITTYWSDILTTPTDYTFSYLFQL